MLNKTTTTTVKTMVNGVAKRAPLNMSGTEIRTETILITPDMARHWLGSNTRSNRRPSAKTVDAYAREMAAGRWLVTHQGIAFNQAGELVDGQHRLLAIIEADVNIWMMVTTGLAVEYNSPIDQGYNRSLAQVLGRQARWISVVRGLYALEQGLGDGGFKATSGMIDEVSGRHSAAIDSVLEIVKTRMLPTGGLAALCRTRVRVAGGPADGGEFRAPGRHGGDVGGRGPRLLAPPMAVVWSQEVAEGEHARDHRSGSLGDREREAP